jgi:hypothetical protein
MAWRTAGNVGRGGGPLISRAREKSAKVVLDRSSGPGCRLLKRGWHDFSIARGCVPLLTLAGQADAQTLGGIYEVPPFFCSPCYPRVDLPVASLAAATHRTFRPRTH